MVCDGMKNIKIWLGDRTQEEKLRVLEEIELGDYYFSRENDRAVFLSGKITEVFIDRKGEVVPLWDKTRGFFDGVAAYEEILYEDFVRDGKNGIDFCEEEFLSLLTV